MVIGTYILIITLNVNGLNAPNKRHRLAEWIQKQDPYICCLQETHFSFKDTPRLEGNNGKRYSMKIEAERNQGQVNLYQKKINFKPKTITGDKKENNIIIQDQFIRRIKHL